VAYPEGEDQEWDESPNWNEDDGDEPDKYVGLLGGFEEQEEPGSPEHDYEWFDGVDETETVALNAMIDAQMMVMIDRSVMPFSCNLPHMPPLAKPRGKARVSKATRRASPSAAS